ncbi:amino acid ABC transporter substrate-binding protein [Rhodocyclus tenuis]|uniref:Transporter substrate-binding domain-containing protein n=2 Tax=Rhodocyclus TaxID=1064 RepID=A0A6L5JUR8_RHOTE|nr:ABC transporter substrate-binding protein [Rhodocyclus gracilis]MQY50949.1 transporter substrate-binding domain-containing protein [Rhodocyclus gracilis]MRD72923.1 transporter substrate-binding domain-containing protein [Rhodocyclus gracilis]NJA88659.1 amino acid ABC transporter substrate-binding protein [Rhodocyclus gracilis]
MRVVARYLGAVACIAALGCGTAQARDWSVIKDSGTIIAATEGAFYPFNYFEGPKLTGFEVEVAEAVAKKLGLKLEWRVVAFDAQLAAIRQDRFDFAIASHGYTAERAKSVDFANPHYCTGGQIAAHKDGPLTVQALKGKTVGVQLATSYADNAKKIGDIGELKTYKADPEVFSALKAKKIDAWISDKWVIKGTLDKNPDSGIVAGEQVFVERVSMILRKNNKELMDQLNHGLAEIMKDGTYAALSQKYFKTDASCH